MKTLLSFLVFHLLLGLGPNAHGSQIINGKEVPSKSMMYMASVQSDNHHICGGFLIRKDFVLTAAHCYSKNLSVVLGTHNLKEVSKSMRYSVKSYKHSDFSEVKYGNDIMLLKLLKTTQQDHRIQPIQISNSAFKLKNNAKCRVAGWGLINHGKRTDVLQMVDVPVVKLDYCRKEWRECRRLELPKDVICAGGYNTTVGFCQGDSGGPLVCGKQAVGIVSFNMKRNCDYPNLPNIYVYIPKHLSWIKKILAKNL